MHCMLLTFCQYRLIFSFSRNFLNQAKRKQVSEKQETLDKVVKCVKDLDGELDESATEVAETQVNELTDRWDIVIKRMEFFFSREIPVMPSSN